MTEVMSETQARKGTYGSYNGGWVTMPPKKVTTTDATATEVANVPLAEGEAVVVRVIAVGSIADESAAAGGQIVGVFRRAAAGNVTQVGATQGTVVEDSAGTPAVAFAADTTNQTVDVRVTGIASETWRWEVGYEYLKV
jgi:hypothetical protein